MHAMFVVENRNMWRYLSVCFRSRDTNGMCQKAQQGKVEEEFDLA